MQADILKEDQGQNTCIFSTEFSLKVMGDIQAYFVEHGVRNFYSVSISGYHIAEAGANPISQLAYHARQRFHLSSRRTSHEACRLTTSRRTCRSSSPNGMDPEYSVLGRVARRMWAIAMRETLRRERAQPEAQVSRADFGPQRCMRRRSTSTTSVPRRKR